MKGITEQCIVKILISSPCYPRRAGARGASAAIVTVVGCRCAPLPRAAAAIPGAGDRGKKKENDYAA